MGRGGPRLTGRRQSTRQTHESGPQLDVRVIRSNKVSKTHQGGKTMSWSMLVVVGDNDGTIGVGLGKARSIPDSIGKAEEAARKNMFSIPRIGSTIPHSITASYCGATVVLHPASPGTGVKAGSAVRQCLEAAGIHDVLAKCLGSRNGVNVAYATVLALQSLRSPEEQAARRGIDVNELVPWLAKARKEESYA